ncbi:hypothetical protein HMPREF9336_01536 [Segniliparus rugosus ATCC BAA-974]|uniref:HTH tetR-type domain-containing protein n=1 Tax=Segniliparus rugosus (strain ATCC BAA-974 / DSM 45345 / CCUG 50838 / CIP 108380 / JCM 13579 / CDC 945) TaxID=679197 RepID=E5XPW4_SEGRC|nr:TetR/AcrR family transcriptional regulator [Segniliparus rugosus]EFV13615.1 hypothetical protein HMPREF9336_01536 [Segniliparus rugosus ATCC BAA-974]
MTTDATSERILEAARDELFSFGIRRTTVEGIARRAGVSHMTVYRRWPAKNDLLLAVVIREIEGLFAAVDREVGALDDPEDKLVAGFVGIYSFARAHPLLGHALETDPESVLPIFTSGAGPSIELATNYLAGHIERAAGTGDSAAARSLAEIFVRLTQSLLLTPRPEALATRPEVEAYARQHLLPLARTVIASDQVAAKASDQVAAK